ncbi:MAG: NADPH:quinone reductase [Planctomyces sp.]|jgi:NADPH2:quinone reductase
MSAGQMRAAWFTETGPPDVIRSGLLPVPVPGSRQALVRVEAAACNPIDTYIRAGTVRLPLPMPYIPGCDLAGTVVAVGADCELQIGDRVWGSNQGLSGRQGTFSEFCAVDQQWLYPLPESVSAKHAAAGALVGITAHLGLFLHAGLQPGETVFVNGGSGGVGSAVVQLAKAAGAQVITTAGSPEKAELCRLSGADHVILYRDEDIDQRLPEIVGRTGLIHLWFETLRMPSLDRCIPQMAMRGRIIFMAGRDSRPEFPVGPFYVRDLRAIGFAMFNASADEQRQSALELNNMLADGRYRPAVGAEFGIAAAAQAHLLQEQKTIRNESSIHGKILILPGMT